MGTVWTDIATTLARIDTMSSASAAADAAELARIVSAVESVAVGLRAAFAPAAGLLGVATDGASDAGQSLAARISTSAAELEPAASVLSDVSGVLAASEGVRGRIAAMAPIMSIPGLRGSVVGAVNSLMVGTYNEPMTVSRGMEITPAGAPEAATSATATLGMPSVAAGDQPVALRPAGPDPSYSPGPVGVVADGGGPRGGPAPASSPREATPNAAPTPTRAPAVPPGTASPDPTVTRGDPRDGPGPAPPAGVAPGVKPTLRPSAVTPGTPVPLRVSLPSTPAGPAGTVSSPGSPVTRVVPPLASTPPTQPGPAAGNQARPAPGGAQPMGPGATRSRDEQTRRPADYLRSTSEGELLLGDQRLVTPAVLAPPMPPPVDDEPDSTDDP
ncbi:hypothetical protein [Gordonia sp. (in: high G+C Gram-positive bacteria)]|uniref:hypothetical protein n=1 Tax=Gordonia sp. (in: high G+C Gram-positive bacteria) TaxID=84139 RepID=UPI00333EF582